MTLARISPNYEPDANKIGWLRVIYHGELRWAMPKMRFGSFEMPSKEWIDKYGDSLRVWIVGQTTPDERDEDAYLVWDGFTFIEGKLPDEALSGFPYVRMTFTENWKIITDDTPGSNLLKILHADGSVFLFDRTSGSEKVVLEDSVLKHKQEWTRLAYSSRMLLAIRCR